MKEYRSCDCLEPENKHDIRIVGPSDLKWKNGKLGMLLVSQWFFFEPKMLLVSRKNEKTELSGPS